VAMFQAPFPVATDVADHRMYPPLHVSLSAGNTGWPPANSTVAGKLVDEEGRSLAEAWVSVYGKKQPLRSTRTDKAGTFLITNVCPGRLQISASVKGPPSLYENIHAEGGDTNIMLVLGPRGDGVTAAPRKSSLLKGKLLPELTEFGLHLDSIATQDKSLLVCFWDASQRPSRSCVQQLAAKTALLQQKGITVVLVQAARTDEDTLRNFLHENRVNFALGGISMKEEKVRFQWGAQALPWLILTDRQRKVVAEGFSVGELDEKLNAP
jgi:hypothetical protein